MVEVESNINRRQTSQPRRRPRRMTKHIAPRSRVFQTNLSILGTAHAELDNYAPRSEQTPRNQRRELHAVAERHEWHVVATYEDAGVSGAKGRDKRPGFDRLMMAVTRREIDMVAAWSVDRLGRSLTDQSASPFFLELPRPWLITRLKAMREALSMQT
jgi:hypothetical protein